MVQLVSRLNHLMIYFPLTVGSSRATRVLASKGFYVRPKFALFLFFFRFTENGGWFRNSGIGLTPPHGTPLAV